MIFKFIVLDLERRMDQFSNEEGYAFYLKSRSLCSYLERFIYSFKIKTPGYNQLGIKGFKKTEYNPYINSSQVLVTHLDFNLEAYKEDLKSGNHEKINEYYIHFLKEGLKTINDDFQLPKSKIIEGIELFRENNYINKWLLIERRITGRGLSCYLECQLTLDIFSIDLVVLERENEIKRERIVSDIPNPIIYFNHFGDLKVTKEGTIQISNRSKNIFYSKNVNEIL
ncbi:hypothetical protein [Pragia fontium]|uniref:hypothetical protein n=1 Tax=Pragia fontium TaxID=82985 RepID=UPI00064A92CF|nr:hypothetical protein [Pragia fontium]AKJ41013.1 hypothetical protein QQ39_02050 [Pragia fontium]